jgi:hypothetical protein
VTEFFAQHFGFLSGAYSLAYAVVNGVALRLMYPAEVLLIYFAIESIIPKTRNSLASTIRSALYTLTSLTINALLFPSSTITSTRKSFRRSSWSISHL